MQSKNLTVLNLARPTPGDDQFYPRWSVFGNVFDDIGSAQDCDILVADQRVEVTNELIKRYPSLKYVCSATTGLTHIKFDSVPWIKVIHLTDRSFLRDIKSVAEFVFRLILTHARPLDGYGHTLNDKTIAIVGGLGRIGSHVAYIAKAFGMFNIVIDRSNPQGVRLLKEADYVSIHIPETEENNKWFDAKKIAMMKKSAYLINTSRGSVLDERALVEAITEGRIAGAALDTVSDIESINQCIGYNLLVTNHIAGSTLEDRIKTDQHIVDKLKMLIDGVEPQRLGSSQSRH